MFQTRKPFRYACLRILLTHLAASPKTATMIHPKSLGVRNRWRYNIKFDIDLFISGVYPQINFQLSLFCFLLWCLQKGWWFSMIHMMYDWMKKKRMILLEYSVIFCFGILLWKIAAFFANHIRVTESIGGEIILLLLPLWWFLGKLLHCRWIDREPLCSNFILFYTFLYFVILLYFARKRYEKMRFALDFSAPLTKRIFLFFLLFIW